MTRNRRTPNTNAQPPAAQPLFGYPCDDPEPGQVTISELHADPSQPHGFTRYLHADDPDQWPDG
ncbi:MAG: hypothetical protein LCH76_12070 [Actinobacteria bacterium]|nr:hypothetical protein [Actinomycetota bacterium]